MFGPAIVELGLSRKKQFAKTDRYRSFVSHYVLNDFDFGRKRQTHGAGCYFGQRNHYSMELLEKIGLSPNRVKNVVKEVTELCK